MALEEFGWFEEILEESVRRNTVSDEKKRMKPDLRTHERGLYMHVVRYMHVVLSPEEQCMHHAV